VTTESKRSYAGDITPEQAWKLLGENPEAVLVDVRTDAEWRFVGVPDLSSLGREVVYIEWNGVDGTRNDNFVAELIERLPAATGDRPVIFLCRSGNRSIGAAEAATAAGVAPSTTCWTVSKDISTPTVTAAGSGGAQSGCPGSSHD
jgi:rhodanese-related sulfurtransferase